MITLGILGPVDSDFIHPAARPPTGRNSAACPLYGRRRHIGQQRKYDAPSPEFGCINSMLWLKAFHIIFVVCWFAGLFYLPRLFVYHAQCEDQATRHQLAVMERRLYRFVTPLGILAIVLGLWMMASNWSYYRSAGWLHSKLALVVLLAIYHGVCGHYVRAFAAEQVQRGHVFFRWFNELPVLILIPVVILAVVKPF